MRARQGIIVLTLAELPSAPTVRWSGGSAVLTSGTNDKSRQLRFFVPPEKLSAAFVGVFSYDLSEQLVAFYADGRLHVRAMFAGNHDLAALAVPAASADTLHARFEGRELHASWLDGHGQMQEQTLRAAR